MSVRLSDSLIRTIIPEGSDHMQIVKILVYINIYLISPCFYIYYRILLQLISNYYSIIRFYVIFV